MIARSGTNIGPRPYRFHLLPDGMGMVLDLAAIPVLPVFKWLAKTGGVVESEMLRTFNCGIGMIVVAEAAKADEVKTALTEAGETPVFLGTLEAFSDGDPVRYTGQLAL